MTFGDGSILLISQIQDSTVDIVYIQYVRIIEFITTAAVRNPYSCRSPKVYQSIPPLN